MLILLFNYNTTIKNFAAKTNELLFYFIALPIFSFGIGKSSAYKIYENIEYKYIKNSALPKEITINEDLKYIGKLSDYIFLMPLKNDPLIIIKQQNITSLTLYQTHQ